MTRINLGYPKKELIKSHLIAEHREIKRVPNMVKSGRAKLTNIPPKFRMGTGHVKFFYNKLGYLKKRYEELYQECLDRKINVTYFGNAWDGIPDELMNDYEPTENDIRLVTERINQRIEESKQKKEQKKLEKQKNLLSLHHERVT